MGLCTAFFSWMTSIGKTEYVSFLFCRRCCCYSNSASIHWNCNRWFPNHLVILTMCGFWVRNFHDQHGSKRRVDGMNSRNNNNNQNTLTHNREYSSTNVVNQWAFQIWCVHIRVTSTKLYRKKETEPTDEFHTQTHTHSAEWSNEYCHNGMATKRRGVLKTIQYTRRTQNRTTKKLIEHTGLMCCHFMWTKIWSTRYVCCAHRAP